LFPNVLREFFLDEGEADQVNTRYFWERKRPIFIRESAVIGMSPVRKRDLDWLVQNRGKEFPRLIKGLLKVDK